MSRISSFSLSVAWFVGLLLLFVAERLLLNPSLAVACSVAAWLLLLGSLVTRIVRSGSVALERRQTEKVLLGLQALGLGALVLFYLGGESALKLASQPLSTSSPKLAVALNVMWVAGIVASVVPQALVELSYASMARAPTVELGRIKEALFSGLGVAFVLIFAFAAYFAASQRDAKLDLSYFRVARPGPATRSIVRALTEPVTVNLFFPPGNEVGATVASYFRDLAKESSKLDIQSYDQAVDLNKAKELGVSGNGAVVIQRGGRKEQETLDTDFDRARSALRNLDKESQKRILTVARARKMVYFTAGHGERTESNGMPSDQRGTIKSFRESLRSLNLDVKDLAAADGLAADVPKDAALVAAMGPITDFLPEEIKSMERYAQSGGRVLLALDPENHLPFAGLVSPWFVTFNTALLANDRYFYPLHHEPSDRTVLATSTVSSHPSVTTLSQTGSRAGVLLIGASSIDAQSKRPSGVTVDFTLKAHPDTWNDLNGNFMFDAPAEVRKPYALAAAVTLRAEKGKEDGRAIVIGDSDLFTDLPWENPGNSYFAVDAAKWLIGDEQSAGLTENENDTPLAHTGEQDKLWFYSTIFLVPACILGVGLGVTRKKKRRSS